MIHLYMFVMLSVASAVDLQNSATAAGEPRSRPGCRMITRNGPNGPVVREHCPPPRVNQGRRADFPAGGAAPPSRPPPAERVPKP